MKCWRVQQSLVPFLDGELPEAEQRAIGAHLEGCPDCARLASELETLPMPQRPELPEDALNAVWAELDEALTPELEAALAGEVRKSAPIDEAPDTTAGRRPWFRSGVQLPWPVAAGYLLFLGLLTGWNLHTQMELAELRDARPLTSTRAAGLTPVAPSGATPAAREDQRSLVRPVSFPERSRPAIEGEFFVEDYPPVYPALTHY